MHFRPCTSRSAVFGVSVRLEHELMPQLRDLNVGTSHISPQWRTATLVCVCVCVCVCVSEPMDWTTGTLVLGTRPDFCSVVHSQRH